MGSGKLQSDEARQFMEGLKLNINLLVKSVFDRYPIAVRHRIIALLDLVMGTAMETEGKSAIEETLKWGEPVYLTKSGSTIRMDWKSKNPLQYRMYFKCTSRLVETFKRLFKNHFEFEGNRALVFKLEDEIPGDE